MSDARKAVEKLREAQVLIEEALVLFKAESDEAYENDAIPHRGNVTGDLTLKGQYLPNMVHTLKNTIYWVTIALDRWHPRINDSPNTKP